MSNRTRLTAAFLVTRVWPGTGGGASSWARSEETVYAPGATHAPHHPKKPWMAR
jgi:hypothetical protein